MFSSKIKRIGDIQIISERKPPSTPAGQDELELLIHALQHTLQRACFHL